MAADFRLIRFQYLDKEADADFLRSYQVQQPQTCPIRQRPKEQFFVKTPGVSGHASILAHALTYVLTYMRLLLDTARIFA